MKTQLLGTLLVLSATLLAACDTTDAPAGPDRLTLGPVQTLPAGEVRYQRHAAIAWGRGSYLVAWQDGYSGVGGRSEIRAIRLDAEGRPLDDRPIVVCKHDQVVENPTVAWADGRWLVAWSDLRNGRDWDVWARWIAADGTPGGAFPVAGGPGSQANPSAGSDRAAMFLLAWQDFASGEYFDIRAARVVHGLRTFEGTSRLLESAGRPVATVAEPVVVMPRGERPQVVADGVDFVVAQKAYAVRVARSGKPTTDAELLWRTKQVLTPTLASAWGRTVLLINTEPSPDPWGWGGNGAIVGVTVGPDAKSPEMADYFAKHSLRQMSGLSADGRIVNVIDRARWLNRPGWPMGTPGGLKHTREGTWPHGQVAAAHNGRSLVVVWPRAKFHDKNQLSNHDLYLRRVAPGWAPVDRAKLRIADGPTDEIDPVLAAGPTGDVLLAWEQVAPAGGIRIHYRVVREAEDTAPPAVDYVVPLDDGRVAVGFDEPIAPATVSAAAFVLDDVQVTAAEFNADPRFEAREVILTTATKLAPGQDYTLRITGLADRSPAANATQGRAVDFELPPGRPSRSGYVENWLLLGPVPNAWDRDWLNPAKVRPAPGASLDVGEGDELRETYRALVDAEQWRQRHATEDYAPMFAPTHQWQQVESGGDVVLPISREFNELEQAAAFAHVYVWSPAGRPAVLRVDSSDGHAAWLNGKLLYKDATGEDFRGFNDYTNQTPVKLDAGWNRLLIRVENRFGRWRAAAQFVDAGDQPLHGLTYSTSPPKR